MAGMIQGQGTEPQTGEFRLGRDVAESADTPEGRRSSQIRQLAPIVHAAQRYAWRQRIKRLFVGLNRFFVQHFSRDGVRWHFEALRTGQPVADIIRRHSMLYPVSRVLLIHRATGILLQQTQRDAEGMRDGDMISGMLTAIRDFVHDSLDVDRHEQLQSIRVGDVTVLIESGPDAVLAGILTGDAPVALRHIFRDCLMRIHAVFGAELREFNGQTARLDGAVALMRPCLQETFVPGDERVSILTVVTVAVPLVLLIGWAGLSLHQRSRWGQYIETLRSVPGLVVTEYGRRGGSYYVEGLRDPLAPDPEALLLSAGFVPREVSSRWSFYQSLDTGAVLVTAARVLRPPRSVTLQFRDGMLVMEGYAPDAWINRARDIIPYLPGVLRWDLDRVEVMPLAGDRQWERFLARLRDEPGILIIDHRATDGRYRVRGLRDPLARSPADIMRESDLDPRDVSVEWEAYVSLDPRIAHQRALRLLQPPSTVRLQVREDVLIAEGAAGQRWLDRAALLGGALEGFARIDLSAVRNLDQEALEDAVRELSGFRVYFLADGRSLWPEQEERIAGVIAAIRRLERAAARAGRHAEIVLAGRSSPNIGGRSGPLDGGLLAERMREILFRQHSPGIPVLAVDGGPMDETLTDGGRREHLVTFAVRIADDTP